MTTLDQKRLARLKELLRPIAHDRRYEARMAAIQGEIRAFFAGMDDAERRRLAPEMLRWHKLARNHNAFTGETSDDLLDLWLTSIAVVATATMAELEKSGWWGASATAMEVLADRDVPWVAEAIELALERTPSCWTIGKLAHGINRLVAGGRIEAPAHDRYAIGIAYGYTFAKGETSLLDRVRRDLPRIEAAIWRQFEVEGGGEISLANFDKYLAAKSGGAWADVLVALAAEGRLDRQRLLDASLAALNRSFGQFCAGWFSRFHEQLSPTLDERSRCAERYLDLVASPIGPTVSLAMHALRLLQRSDRLEARLVIEGIEPALYARTAATAKAALGLLASVARSEPRLAPDACRIAAAGLEHPKSDVQAAALQVIEDSGAGAIVEARDAIVQRLDVMSAALRGRAARLIANEAMQPPSQSPVPASDADTPLAAMLTAARTLPRDIRRLAGVDAAVAALENGAGDVPRAVFTGMEVPRLSPDTAITPIATFEELIDEALVAVEHFGDLDRVERVLAGALRFAVERPVDIEVLLGPLARSVKRYRARSHDGSCWATPRGALQIVLSAFLGWPPIEFSLTEADPRAILAQRADAVADAIRKREARLQLSTPTHRGFWIDPLVLVERSGSMRPETALGLADQLLALLRLAPDNRSEASKAASSLAGEWGAALRYALGGNEALGKTRALWITAARARAPFDDLPALKRFTGVSLPGVDRATSFGYRIGERQDMEGATWRRVLLDTGDGDAQGFDFGKEGGTHLCNRTWKPKHPDAGFCLPTLSLSDPATLWQLDTYHSGSMFHAGTWAPAIWPQHPEPVFALAAKAACMLDGNNGARPANEPLADGLRLILDADVPLGPMAQLMLCRGLNALDKAAAQASVDALIATIDDGRLDGQTLGEAMHAFLDSGLVFGKRWPERLKEVARSSALARLVVRRALELALHPIETGPKLRDIHAWIETLLELSIEAGEAIDDPATRTALAGSYATGKAKPIAAKALDLKSSGNEVTRAEAAMWALERRIERARRWLA